MRYCNCGGTMEGVVLVGEPKVFVCSRCGATLMVNRTGETIWASAHGVRETYRPRYPLPPGAVPGIRDARPKHRGPGKQN